MKTLSTLLILFAFLSASAQGSLELLGHYTFPTGTYCSGLVGYADSLGNEYALVCYTSGIAVIDISDAANPTLIDTVPCNYAPGTFNREIRTYKQYAYTVSEFGDGLTIIDLSQIHNGVITYNRVYPDNRHNVHTIFIDENGIAYLNGSPIVLMVDLNVDPLNPPVIGTYTNVSVHDCFVRNDTMWAACISIGEVRVIDVRNKAFADEPSSLIASWHTPADFTHNVWLSDDSKYLFTTDERNPSYLTCYDVTNLENIVETDRVMAQGDNMAIMHNTHYKDGYCYTASYTYGVTMHNASFKYHLVEEAHFDTSPNSGEGFSGAWDVWPYLPSGNIIVSDIQTGLWVLKPHYSSGTYIVGIITDSVCENNIYDAEIKILEDSTIVDSDLLGVYSTHSYLTGYVSLQVSKAGYNTRIIDSVLLTPGSTVQLNISLYPLLPKGRVTVVCRDKETHAPIANTKLLFINGEGQEYAPSTDYSGVFHSCNMALDTFIIYAGKWGYSADSVTVITSYAHDTTTILLQKGYYDDFLLDYGWSTTLPAGYNGFRRTIPVGTNINGSECNPYSDLSNDLGLRCYVTGSNSTDPYGSDLDLFDALLSPSIDLSTYNDPYICYSRWYINGYVETPNDQLNIYLSNGSFSSVLVDSVPPGNEAFGWVYRCIRLKDFPITIDNDIKLQIEVHDAAPDNITEAAFDGFRVIDSVAATVTNINPAINAENITVYPNPFTDDIALLLTEAMQDIEHICIYNSSGAFITRIQIPANTQQLKFDSNLSAGVYILKATTATQSYSTKLVKLK